MKRGLYDFTQANEVVPVRVRCSRSEYARGDRCLRRACPFSSSGGAARAGKEPGAHDGRTWGELPGGSHRRRWLRVEIATALAEIRLSW